MPAKKVFLRLILVVILVGGITAGVVLVRQRVVVNREAAVPGGKGAVKLSPGSGNYKTGDQIPVSVYFNTSGIAISGITMRLTYPYVGATPETRISDIRVNAQFAAAGNWSCPTASTTAEAGNVYIDVACANISAAGYSTSSDTILATFNINVDSVPSNNPIVLRFDPSQSIMTQKTTGQDILRVPSGDGATGTYTVEGQAQPQATAVPSQKPVATSVPATATPTKKPSTTTVPTATATVRPTSTPRSTATLKPTSQPTAVPTLADQLPDAGISYPTIVLLGLGIILLGAALLLAL